MFYCVICKSLVLSPLLYFSVGEAGADVGPCAGRAEGNAGSGVLVRTFRPSARQRVLFGARLPELPLFWKRAAVRVVSLLPLEGKRCSRVNISVLMKRALCSLPSEPRQRRVSMEIGKRPWPARRACRSRLWPEGAGASCRQGARCRRADRAAAPPAPGAGAERGAAGHRRRCVERPRRVGSGRCRESRGGFPGPSLRKNAGQRCGGSWRGGEKRPAPR